MVKSVVLPSSRMEEIIVVVCQCPADAQASPRLPCGPENLRRGTGHPRFWGMAGFHGSG
jgi:hypothetical protein